METLYKYKSRYGKSFFRRNKTIKSKYIRNVSTNEKHADKLKPFTASTELSTFTTSPIAHFSTSSTNTAHASTSTTTINSSLPPYTTCISMNSPLLDKFKNNSASKREKPKKIRRGQTKIKRKPFTNRTSNNTSIKLFYSNINGYR